MLVFIAFFFLFFLVLVLVVVFHSFLWNCGGNSLGGTRSWVSSFECGFLSQRFMENYFSYTYFMLLVFFVVFDLEVSLLLNLPFQGVLFKNMGYYLFFLALMSVGFVAEVSKGYVVWSY